MVANALPESGVPGLMFRYRQSLKRNLIARETVCADEMNLCTDTLQGMVIMSFVLICEERENPISAFMMSI